MLSRYLDGEVRAFDELVGRFGPLVYGYLHRVGIHQPAADDLFQEAFLRVHTAACSYKSEFPFRVWLLCITHNLIRSHFRKVKVRRVLSGSWLRGSKGQDQQGPHDPPDPAPGPEQQAQSTEQLRRLEEAISHLSDGPRQAILLTQLEGLNLEEAAKVLGTKVATVKTWIRRGRLALLMSLAESEMDVAS